MTTTHDLPDGPPASPVREGRALAGRWTIGARFGRRGEVHFHHAADANGAASVAAWRYRGFEPLPRFLVHLGHDREAWSAVHHPAVARTLDIGREVGETTCFWVVRTAPASPLSDHLAVSGAVEPSRAVGMAIEIGDALDAIHASGLVHGAVRADTVLLDGASGRVQLAWGGLVSRLARAGVDVGHDPEDEGATAPEVLAGGSAFAETDVYGLAALLFTLLHGRPPFADGAPSPSFDRDLPGDLADLLERALRRDGDLRPTLRTFTDHLDELAVHVGWDTTDRPEDPPRVPASVGGGRTSRPLIANTPTSVGRSRAPATPVTLSRSSVEPRADPATFGVPILTPAPRRLQTSMVAVVLLLAVLVAAMGSAVWLLRSPGASPALPAAAPAPAPAVGSAPVVAPAVPALLTLRTDPPGAVVWDGETLLGTTPLELPIVSHPDAPPRRLEIRAEGYATHTLVQPTSPTNVLHHVVLQRLPSRPRRPPDLELREQR